MSKETQYYTYLILDPRINGTFIYDGGKLILPNLPIYSGKGIRKRCFEHSSDAKHTNEKTDKLNLLREIIEDGYEPIIYKVLENVTEDVALSKEIELIWVIGRADMKMGSLTNKTWGGERGGYERKDLSGQKFGRLIVNKFVGENIHGDSLFDCLCECGTKRTVLGYLLRNGNTKSCGCYNKDIITSHGMTGTPIYKLWRRIKDNYYNKNVKGYYKYGAKGIKVCDRWLESFDNFYKDVGDIPSVDSLFCLISEKNDFTPENWEWMTKKQRCGRRKSNRYLTINGETKIIAEWIKISGAKFNTVTGRLQRGWSHEEAVYGKSEK